MPVPSRVLNAGTGSSQLADVGALSYNSVTFTSLYKSKVSGVAVLDNAGWTTKYVEWTISVDGVVTLPAGAATTDAAWVALRRQLDACAGTLIYNGKGFGPLIVNQAKGGGIRDVAWGPIPKTLEFTPLGASRAAAIRWTVTTRIPEIVRASGGVGGAAILAGAANPVLQFNEEISTTYDADGYATISVKGTLEVPITRTAQTTRTVSTTVDDFRKRFLDFTNPTCSIFIDLTRFHIPKRNFNYSRDRRTCEWELVAEELPPMGLPPGCPTARGTFSVRPIKDGPGLVRWHCTLRATYIVKKSYPREIANLAFVGLLLFRMDESKNGIIPIPTTAPAPGPAAAPAVHPSRVVGWGTLGLGLLNPLTAPFAASAAMFTGYGTALTDASAAGVAAGIAAATTSKAILINYGFDEGIYLDSKTITFEASWRLITTWAGLLAASGVWKDGGFTNRNAWVTSIADVMGYKGNVINGVDPKAEAIVDFGS